MKQDIVRRYEGIGCDYHCVFLDLDLYCLFFICWNNGDYVSKYRHHQPPSPTFRPMEYHPISSQKLSFLLISSYYFPVVSSTVTPLFHRHHHDAPPSTSSSFHHHTSSSLYSSLSLEHHNPIVILSIFL